jgi:hypothetical protein
MRMSRQNSKISNYNDFHTDSVWTILDKTNTESQTIITGGRDGNIFETNLVDQTSEQLYQGDPKFPITCMSHDSSNNKLWYGTTDSSI